MSGNTTNPVYIIKIVDVDNAFWILGGQSFTRSQPEQKKTINLWITITVEDTLALCEVS